MGQTPPPVAYFSYTVFLGTRRTTRFPLKNGGGAGETAITATLSSVDPYVSISDNLSFYPNIGPGATVAPSDPFVDGTPSAAGARAAKMHTESRAKSAGFW